MNGVMLNGNHTYTRRDQGLRFFKTLERIGQERALDMIGRTQSSPPASVDDGQQ